MVRAVAQREHPRSRRGQARRTTAKSRATIRTPVPARCSVIDGNTLTIAFDKAGEKRVVDSFVARV